MLGPGDHIGTYRIIRQIARGGMSRVYLAESLPAHVPWVIKEVAADHPLFAHAARSLDTEIRLLKSIEHPSLVKIVDAFMEKDALYMVTEYIDGVTLASLLREEGAQDEETVVSYALEITDAVAYLHSRTEAYLYCDLKPSNLMLTADHRIKLIDFGTAVTKKDAAGPDRVLVGTKGYAAPEQYEEGEALDETTDVYALGCTLRAMLSGGDPEDRRLKGASRAMKQIVKRCTHPDKKRRYRCIAEADYDLRHRDALGVRGKMSDVAVLILCLMFLISGAALLWRILFGTDDRWVTAVVCLLLAFVCGMVFHVPEAILRLTGFAPRREVARMNASSRINGVFRIGSHMPTKRALSWQDVEIPLDDEVTDVRIDYEQEKVNVIAMDGFVLEKDIVVSQKDHYAL